jgi:hypothetical protein
MLRELPGYEQHLAGRVLPDLVNEPRWVVLHVVCILMMMTAMHHFGWVEVALCYPQFGPVVKRTLCVHCA